MKMGILAAGEGSRLQSMAPFKPLVEICGAPLLERTLEMLSKGKPSQIKIIFNEMEKEMDMMMFPSLKSEYITYFFKTTPSSLHSLFEVLSLSDLEDRDLILISMVDTIIKKDDFLKFVHFCKNLGEGEHAVLTTTYIDDENPLTLQTDSGNKVIAFQTPKESSTVITSGMYCFSKEALDVASECIDKGMVKTRNFLTSLVEQGHIVRSFCVEKTLDIDRPEDVNSAEIFLGED